MRARSLIGLVTAAAALGLPAAGHAGTYCVGVVPGCVGAPAGDLQSALSSAELSAEPDVVRIGAGEFTAGAAGFTYVAASPVEIVGAGAGATVLTTSAPAPGVLRVQGPAATTLVSDLSVRSAATGPRDVLVVSGAAERVEVTGQGRNQAVTLLAGSTLRSSTVVAPLGDEDAPSYAVQAVGAGATVEDVRLEGGVGVSVVGDGTTISRARIVAIFGVSVRDADARVTSSLVRVDDGGIGLGVLTSGIAAADVEADGVTVAGRGADPVATGVSVRADGGPARLVLRNSALVDLVRPLARTSGAGSPAAIEVSWSAVDLTRPVLAAGPGSLALGPGNLPSPPGLLPAISDHRPAAGSPLVDAGDPAPPGAEGPALDLEGRPRVLGPRRDIGAFELPPAPLVAGGAPPALAGGGPPPALRPPARPCAGRRGTALKRCRIAVRLRADLRRCARVRSGARARCRAVASRRAGLARCRLLAPRRAAACRVMVLARPLPRARRARA
jgi:hypothetical protein